MTRGGLGLPFIVLMIAVPSVQASGAVIPIVTFAVSASSAPVLGLAAMRPARRYAVDPSRAIVMGSCNGDGGNGWLGHVASDDRRSDARGIPVPGTGRANIAASPTIMRGSMPFIAVILIDFRLR